MTSNQLITRFTIPFRKNLYRTILNQPKKSRNSSRRMLEEEDMIVMVREQNTSSLCDSMRVANNSLPN